MMVMGTEPWEGLSGKGLKVNSRGDTHTLLAERVGHTVDIHQKSLNYGPTFFWDLEHKFYNNDDKPWLAVI